MTVTTWVVGDGGQAREIADLIRRFAPQLSLAGLVGPDDEEALLQRSGAVVLGLGFAGQRLALLRRFADHPTLDLPTIVHPGSDVGDGTTLGRGVVVSAGCVLTTDVRLGDGCLLNPRSGAGHDSVLGAGCVLNPGANVSGSVHLGDGVLVGSGATVLQGLRIGDGAVIGAGAVVTRDVPAGETVIGVPARSQISTKAGMP